MALLLGQMCLSPGATAFLLYPFCVKKTLQWNLSGPRGLTFNPIHVPSVTMFPSTAISFKLSRQSHWLCLERHQAVIARSLCLLPNEDSSMRSVMQADPQTKFSPKASFVTGYLKGELLVQADVEAVLKRAEVLLTEPSRLDRVISPIWLG
jgi:hypothetical protein